MTAQGLDAAAARARRALEAAGARIGSSRRDASDDAAAALGEIERKVSGLGAKVAAERAERGWSLAQLAQRAGISPAAVHKIEKSGMTPTIASLMKIAAALGRSVSFFVEESASQDVNVIRGDERAKVYTSKQGLELRNLSGRYGPFLIHGADAFVEPHASSGPEPMSHPGEELVIVHDGAMVFTVDGARIRTRRRRLDPFPHAAAPLVAQPERRARTRHVARGPRVVDDLARDRPSRRAARERGRRDLPRRAGRPRALRQPRRRGRARLLVGGRAGRPRLAFDDPPLLPRRHAVPAGGLPAAQRALRGPAGAGRARLVRAPRRLDGAGRLRVGAVRDRGGQRRRGRVPRHHRRSWNPRRRTCAPPPRRRARRRSRPRAHGSSPPRPRSAGASGATCTTARSSGSSTR